VIINSMSVNPLAERMIPPVGGKDARRALAARQKQSTNGRKAAADGVTLRSMA
jgi:hypothetical protein